MECSKCSSIIEDDTNYCPFCGTLNTDAKMEVPPLVRIIRESAEENDYDTIAKYALLGNAFAEYKYVQAFNYDVERIKQEAEKNNAAAIALLGIKQFIHSRPQERVRNQNDDMLYEKAIKMVQKAAEMKDPIAMDYVAEWFASGKVKGIQKSEMNAYRYTKESADLECPPAMFRLGKWHLEGSHGVSKSPEIGNELVEKAAYYGISAAMEMLKEKDKTWFETDYKIDEDKETQELSLKYLMSLNQKYEDDIISADELLDFDFDIQLDSKKGKTYNKERNFVSTVVSGCDSLDDYIKAWDTFQQTEFVIYDPYFDMKSFRETICKKADINIDNLDSFIDQYHKKQKEAVEKHDYDVKENSTEAPKQDTKVESNSGDTEYDKKSKDYLKLASNNIIIKNNQIILKSIYGFTFPQKPKKTTLEVDWNHRKYLDYIRYSFYIHPKEDVYFISLTDGSRFNKKACGYVVASTGIYFKSTKKEKPIIITWDNYIRTNIYMGDYSKKTKENMLMINDHAFLFKSSNSDLDFLLELKNFIGFVNEYQKNN
ncbi:MAG: hypothetical protein NC452_17785 [Eubacterium sp.]|nr:hypothetical protein [Eubacterium sp.]